MRRLAALALLLPVLASGEPARSRRELAHVLDRLTFGPRPGDVRALKRLGVEAFIERQLNPASVDDAALERRLAGLETLTMTSAQLARRYHEKRLDAGDKSMIDELAAAKLLRAAYSERQLQEVMVDFWFNHFNVSAGRLQVRPLVTSYERDVIRPRVLGKFRDLLGAVVRSPAMLVYLDNVSNTADEAAAAPGARPAVYVMDASLAARDVEASQRAMGASKMGLNENLGRELLELHTLGADGGYTQEDVIGLARVLTGWSVDWPHEANRGKVSDFTFVFRPALHDPAEVVVLGRKLSGAGPEEGERALDLLASHPSTAKFLARKLCRRFVDDEPPESCVAAAAARFTASGGDIAQTLRAVFASPAFLEPKRFRSKVKSPFEYVASLVRATRAEISDPAGLANATAGMGQELYFCEAPSGYPDASDAWTAPGALAARRHVVSLLLHGAADPSAFAASSGTDGVIDSLVDAYLAGEISRPTLEAIRRASRAPEVSDASGSADLAKVAALVLGSPDFQRR